MSRSPPSPSPRARARSALRDALVRACPAVRVDELGYVSDWRENLVPAVSLRDFEADLSQGSGDELATKFRAAHSSSALAVNAFAPFRRRLPDLAVGPHRGFTAMAFERKCPSGLGGTPPNLDLVLESPDHVLAIESKCLEYLTPKAAGFSPAYFDRIVDGRRDSACFREMVRLRDAPTTYRCLDAAQLIKHAFGLARSYPDRAVTLLYLWWEPLNPDADHAFDRHRAEVAAFADRVAGSVPAFEGMSYSELWDQWEYAGLPAALARHLSDVRARYAVTL